MESAIVKTAVLPRLLLVLAFLNGMPSLCAAAPNVVFVMADDLGWSDTSNSLTNLGNPSDFYETPILERLASEGMAFTNAYANQNCAPTRSAILSGQYAPRPTNNVYQVGSLNRGGNGTMLVGPPQGLPTGTDAIPNSTFTYAEMLQGAGYTTAHFGKFHVVEAGTAASDIVSFHGFDENYGGNTNGGPGNYHASGGTFGGSISSSLDAYAANYTQTYVDQNIKPFNNGATTAAIDALVGTNKHVSDALADAAIDFMEREKNGSFLVQFNTYAVHTPIGNSQARDDLLAKYQNKTAGSQDSNASFGALIEGLDQSVARLIDYLETTPDPTNPGQMLDENTLVVFYSDNGGRQNQSNNGPLKGQKGELDEGGIRVPMIAWSGNPNLVDGGTINHTPVNPTDFYKTFAGVSGTSLPVGVTLDGEDLSGIIADNAQDLGRENLFWHLPGYLVDGARNQRPQSVVRSGDWKLLYNYESQSFELYDLANDISESTNVAASNPAVVGTLGQSLMDHLVEVDAPLATLRSGQITLNITGPAYANGQITVHNGPVTISAGEEVPFVLGSFAPTDLTWIGRDSANWTVGGDNNFLGTSGFTTYKDSDNVTFNDLSLELSVAIPADVSPGDVVIAASANFVLTGSGGIVDGTLTVNGPGSLELANLGNAYPGETNVNGGTLKVTSSTGLGDTFVASGASVGGVGTVQGNLNSSGNISPGASAGTLSVLGDVVLTDTSVLDIELAPGASDLLNVSGALQIDGELQVSLIDGLIPAAGQTYNILDAASVSGQFDSLDLPLLSVGLLWDVSSLETIGELSVVAGLQGDFDQDNDVDGIDFLAWQMGLGIASGASVSDGDADFDGDVDMDDLSIWESNYGLTITNSLAQVPEPSTVLLTVVGIAALAMQSLKRPVRYTESSSDRPTEWN